MEDPLTKDRSCSHVGRRRRRRRRCRRTINTFESFTTSGMQVGSTIIIIFLGVICSSVLNVSVEYVRVSVYM